MMKCANPPPSVNAAPRPRALPAGNVAHKPHTSGTGAPKPKDTRFSSGFPGPHRAENPRALALTDSPAHRGADMQRAGNHTPAPGFSGVGQNDRLTDVPISVPSTDVFGLPKVPPASAFTEPSAWTA